MKINSIKPKDKEKFDKCVNIAKQLILNNASSNIDLQQFTSSESTIDFYNFYLELCELYNYEDSVQKRGFAFETWLNSYFFESDLNPRKSFKILGEQIDGSFELNNNIYLIEAKWTHSPIGKPDLVNFNEKARSKSTFTRGVFISYSGFTQSALETLAHGRSISIILMSIQEILLSLHQKIHLKDVLTSKIRALAEEGAFCKDYFQH